jgi:hypothetical protein
MDEYADIIYVDTRNADPRDHRTGTSSSSGARPSVPANWRPATPVSSGSSGHERVAYVSPAQPVGYPPVGYTRPMAYPTAYPAGYPAGYPGQVYPGQGALAGLFGSMTTGQILDLVAVAFAALQPLPAAPTATKDTNTDVGNLVLYQAALAQHAKRDEQVRTLGGLISKLVG